MIAWRNLMWDKEGICWGRPTSYLMSVLLIKAYKISVDKSLKR